MGIRGRTVSILFVFRPDDPDALAVLRLRAAVNDLGTLIRMIQHKQGTTAEINATYRYALRMGALHIEAIKTLVKDEVPRLARRYFKAARFEEARERAKEAQQLIRDPRLSQVIGFARHKFAGHYDNDYFVRGLRLLDRGDLMELPASSVHFDVCDILFDQVLAHESHSAYKLNEVIDSVGAALEAMMDLQRALVTVGNALVFALHDDAQGLLHS